jgi:hypothetical protein
VGWQGTLEGAIVWRVFAWDGASEGNLPLVSKVKAARHPSKLRLNGRRPLHKPAYNSTILARSK